jgi:hypothetical protein
MLARGIWFRQEAFDQTPVQKVSEVVQVADVVALKFKPCALVCASAQNAFDVFVGVFENQVAAVFQVLAFPIVFQLGLTVQLWSRPKLMELMLSEATSVWKRITGRMRSSTVMWGLPPVVMLITGSRACRW